MGTGAGLGVGTTAARRALAVVVALLLVSGAGAAYLRQGASEVTVDSAVAEFRESQARRASPSQDGGGDMSAPAATPHGGQQPDAGDGRAPASPAGAAAKGGGGAQSVVGGAPPTTVAGGTTAGSVATATAQEGVYVYATDGYEETDALGGIHRDYPSETAMTLVRAGCGGWVQRWQPLEERWDETELCPEGADVAVRRFVMYHEFFQQGMEETFTCPQGSHVFRRNAPAGASWTWKCASDASTIETVTRVVGVERMTIGGTSLDVVHLHYSSVVTGGNRGTQEQHRWLHPDTGLNVKIQTKVDMAAESPFGPVNYDEEYTITLTSLSPRR